MRVSGELPTREVAAATRRRNLIRWAPPVLAGAAVVLFGWTIALSMILPAKAEARNWATAWVGLDAMEVVGLALLALLVRRRDPRASIVAGATGGLFLIDAWFDAATAGHQWAVLVAYVLAAVCEIPAAVACTAIALTALTWRDGGVHANHQGG